MHVAVVCLTWAKHGGILLHRAAGVWNLLFSTVLYFKRKIHRQNFSFFIFSQYFAFSQILGCFSSFFVYNLSHLLEQVQESKNWELSLFLTLCKCYISDSHFVSHIRRWVIVPTDCLAANNANYCCYALTKICGWYIKFKKKKKASH